MQLRFAARLFATSVSLGLIITPALARPANQLTDLVGSNSASGQGALEGRGFTYITGNLGEYSTQHSYYWHSGDKNCIHTETYDGRLTAITDAKPSDCNQRSGDKGAAVAGAVVGAALLGALVASRSHHHEGKNYDERQSAEFDRGYRDGLYNGSYHNYDRADAYAHGYQQGVAEREANLSHHHHRGGYAQVASFGDLQGVQASRAMDAITARGFASVDTMTSGSTVYGIYYNRRTRQCVQMTLADDRVYDIRDIKTHPNCR